MDGFFASIVYEREKEEKEKNGEAVGIDVGIKNTLTMSNGEVISMNTKRIMALVRKAEKLQSVIDRRRAINKKRGIKNSKEDWSVFLSRRDTASICVKWFSVENLYAEPSHFSVGSMFCVS